MLPIISHGDLKIHPSKGKLEYSCIASDLESECWEMKNVEEFIDSKITLDELKTHHLAYGIILSPSLQIPLINALPRHIFAIMDVEEYAENYREDKLAIYDLQIMPISQIYKKVIEEKCQKNQIVLLWKKNNLITYIGVSNKILVGQKSRLAGLGCCINDVEPFTKPDSLFDERPAHFSISKLDAKLIQIPSDQYEELLKPLHDSI